MAKEPARNTQPIRAIVRPINLAQHELEITLELPKTTLEKGAVVALPAWTPGSYLVRDYARFVDRVVLRDSNGADAIPKKLDKQRWQLPPQKGTALLSYRVFCNDLSVRTNHVDSSHAQVVGAATFMYLEQEVQRPIEIRFEGFPAHWKVATSLALEDGAYRASDYGELVDSPFELGTFRMHAFRALNADFEFAVTGEHNGDEARIVAGAQKIVTQAGSIFGGFPFKRFTFMLTFSPKASGGLEHKNSTTLLSDPFRFNKTAGYEGLFGLISHEFFHAWNVKRLHDPVLGPFDYSRENYTRLLWFHEGLTDYVDNLIAMKAGVISWPTVAKEWAKRWTENEQRPGRLEQSLEEASFDAWIRFYKPTEFTPNSTVDYYEAGALVGLMMDAQLRMGSKGLQGIEDLFALLWRRHGENGLTDMAIRTAYQELSGLDPETFWDAHIRHCGPLDSSAIESAFGLKFEAKAAWETAPPEDLTDATLARFKKSYVGLEFPAAPDVATIKNVLPGSPAFAAGLSYGQEILAVDGWRTTLGTEVQQRIADVPVGQKILFTVVDRGRIKTVSVPVIENPQRALRIVPDPKASEAQKARFSTWTGQPFPTQPPLLLKTRSGKP